MSVETYDMDTCPRLTAWTVTGMQMQGRFERNVQRVCRQSALRQWRHTLWRRDRIRSGLLHLLQRLLTRTLQHLIAQWKAIKKFVRRANRLRNHMYTRLLSSSVRDWFVRVTHQRAAERCEESSRLKLQLDVESSARVLSFQSRLVEQSFAKFRRAALRSHLTSWIQTYRDGALRDKIGSELNPHQLRSIRWLVEMRARTKMFDSFMHLSVFAYNAVHLRSISRMIHTRARRAKNLQAFACWNQVTAARRRLQASLKRARRQLLRALSGIQASALHEWKRFVSQEQVVDQKFSVGLTIPCRFEDVMQTAETRQAFDKKLRESVRRALDISPESIDILCHQRGSVKAEVVLDAIPVEETNKTKHARSAKSLAKELSKASTDPTSPFSKNGLMLCATSAEVHGPVSTSLLKVMRSAMSQQRDFLGSSRLETMEEAKRRGTRQLDAKRLRATLQRGWDQWRSNTADIRRLKHLSCKALKQFMMATLCNGFTRWRDHAVTKRRMKAKALKVVQRLLNRALVEGFERWRDQAVSERQLKAKALKVVQRLLNRALVEGFERWRGQVAEERQLKAKALKVVQRLLNRALVEGFERWRDQAAEERQLKAKALKVVQRLLNRALVEGFERWRDQAVSERQLKAKALLKNKNY